MWVLTRCQYFTYFCFTAPPVSRFCCGTWATLRHVALCQRSESFQACRDKGRRWQQMFTSAQGVMEEPSCAAERAAGDSHVLMSDLRQRTLLAVCCAVEKNAPGKKTWCTSQEIFWNVLEGETLFVSFHSSSFVSKRMTVTALSSFLGVITNLLLPCSDEDEALYEKLSDEQWRLECLMQLLGELKDCDLPGDFFLDLLRVRRTHSLTCSLCC